jgi:hypothetical protein
MKLVNKVVTVVAAIASIGILASCGSTGKTTAAAPAPVAIPPAPAKATEPPHYKFDGAQLKIEIESMFLNNFLVFPDAKASGYYATKLIDETSTAVAVVSFPAGTYEGLVSEDAPDGNHDSFNVFINDTAYRCYPSDPPIGTYELTTRTPMNITFDKDTEVTIKIQQNDPNKPNKPGETGMKLDFIQFTKK